MSRTLPLCALLGCLLLPAPETRPAGPPAAPAAFRLDRRVPLTTSRVVGWPDPPPPYRTKRVFERLTFRYPVYLTSDPAYPGLFVVEQYGKIVYFKPDAKRTDLFCEIKDHETYSFTFHPKHRTNRFVYVFANGPRSARRKSNRIYRFTVKGDPPRCEPASRKLIIEWVSNGHNGGDLLFGPDGRLYVSSGDGTSDSDGDVTGQDLRDLCSGVLRIDVDRPEAGKGYSVPKDNPFVRLKDARPELYAFGLRNPWRMSVDRTTGNVWIGDVGQDLWEMIHLLKRGANYGWSVFEGSHPFQPRRKLGPGPVVKPVVEHPHSESRSITGGHVYRGKRLKGLRGVYVYGDYSTGKVWGFRYESGKVTWRKELASTRLQIVGFGTDAAGELYLVDHGGQVHQLEPAPAPVGPSKFPRKLSESGLFARVAGHRTLPALIPYSVNSPLWSDGAHKERFLAIPGTGQVDYTEQSAWRFPEGTVLVKTFALDLQAGNPATRRRIETRFLTLQQGEWYGYSYAWKDDQTDAELVPAGGQDRVFTIKDRKSPGGSRRQTWRYPSRVECMVCHTRAAAWVLGLNTAQMNRPHDYGGGVVMNQLSALEKLGVFRVPLADHFHALEQSAQVPGHVLRAALRLPMPKDWRKRYVDPLQKRVLARRDRWRQRLLNDLGRKGRHTTRLPRDPEDLPRLADPADGKADLSARARSYLQSNCTHCHVEAGGGNSAIDLHVNTPLKRMRLVGVRPLHDKFGLRDALLVAPGAPERSVLLHRVSKTGAGRMPPVASSVVDEEGVKVLRAWIKGLK
jgi:glucose/arabinose dehydrogenase